MRVPIAAGIYPPDIGGPATYAHTMAEALVKAGHTTGVVCYGSADTTVVEGGVPVVRVRRQGALRTAIVYFYKLLTLVRGYDLLFAQGPVAGGLQSLLVTLIKGTPYVVKITGDYAWEQAQAGYGLTDSIDQFQTRRSGLPLRVRFLRVIQSNVARRAALVIVPSEYLRSMVVAWGVKENRCRVVYNAVSSAGTRPASEAPATLRALAGNETKLVLSVGRLVPWKGFGTLISIWPEVVAVVPEARLGILGSGPEEALLRQAIAASSVAETICLSHAHGAEVQAAYSLATLFALNSGYEGFSHTILEAQSAGLACAVSRVGGNPELIQNKETGELFEYDNEHEIKRAIITLLQDDALRHSLATKGSTFAAAFTIERMYRATEQLLDGVINAHSRNES